MDCEFEQDRFSRKMELREFETVRPTTQQGLVAAKPQTPLPSRNVIDSSYFTTELHRLKRTLIEESRQTKVVNNCSSNQITTSRL